MPDGKGGSSQYLCQESKRICLGAVQMQHLKQLGLRCERMSFDKSPQRDASQFIKVVSVEDAGVAETVYCFNEPKRHTAIFNGVITGQCSEITLASNGGYCVIGSTVPYHCNTVEEWKTAAKETAKALMRTNLMPSLYKNETKKTNRIGVGMTGIHEFAWKNYGFDFLDLVNEEKSQLFWDDVDSVRAAVQEACEEYAKELNVKVPVTQMMIAPNGTTAKLFHLTEGAHLPAAAHYLRWVQFNSDSDDIKKYQSQGYPTRDLVKYERTTIVGFPTELEIGKIMPEDRIVFAHQATPEQQYQWLRLLEKYWIGSEFGNQVSYTLKYHRDQISKERYREVILENQRTIKCCSVLPNDDLNDLIALYEYSPEEPITKAKYDELMANIDKLDSEALGREHVDCSTGACPINFKE
jgi:hypothetical protein